MKTKWIAVVAIVGLFGLAQGVSADSANRFGIGVNFWTVVDDIDGGNIDENGSSWLFTYQHRTSALIKLEADLEVFDKGYLGIDNTVYAPEVYLVLGSIVYGAVGAGILYADGDFADDLFYALRAGLDLEVISQFYLDLNVNYRFAEWSSLSDENTTIDGNTTTLGVALRYEF